MKFSKKTFAITIGIAIVVGITLIFAQQNRSLSQPDDKSAVRSSYAGQETTRAIKALSQDDIEGLLAGAGTPFGGMAKPAELNGYPGPRHVLDAVKAGELVLTKRQQGEIEALYEEMRPQAIALGKRIINIEEEIDNAFANKTITENFLQEKISESANLYGQLRVVHLKYHLSMIGVLTLQQVEQYNKLRGYTSNDPCEDIPEGHDMELWKKHNNCE